MNWLENEGGAGSGVAADLAERRLLGGLLRDPDQIGDLAASLRPEEFRHDAHRVLWGVLLALWEARRPVDLPTVFGELARGSPGRLGREGNDAAYLAELWELDPTGGNVPANLRRVKDAAILRRLYLVGGEIVHLAQDCTGPAAQALEQAERSLFALSDLGSEGQTVPLREAVQQSLDRIDARVNLRNERGENPGIPSGIPPLDDLTSGWQAGELVVVAARPSVGKTAFSLSLVCAASRAGYSVLFASLEQSAAELAERLLVAESGVSADHLRRGALLEGDDDRILAARDVISQLPILIDDCPRQSLLRIAANARRCKARGALCLLAIDYLQLIEPESRKDPRHEQVAQISRRLKALARELKVPVIALAQLNREVESRTGQKPRLSDLRESGAIEQDADCVLLLHRPPEFPHTLELILAKQRNGPVGEVTVRFDRARMRFEAPGAPGGTPGHYEAFPD